MKKNNIPKLFFLLILLSFQFTYAQVNFNLANNSVFIVQNGCTVNIVGNINVDNSSKIRNEGGTLNISGTPVLNGTVEYAANGNQTIINATHGTLKISGTGNKSLAGNVDINSNLTLGGTAKIITGSNILTLKGSSSTITGGSFGSTATSWIVTGNGTAGAGNTGIGGIRIENIGPGGRTGNILFPTGPTTTAYNPAQLNNTGTLDNFLLTVSDQQPIGCFSDQCVNRTWNISESLAGGTNATIGLQFNTGEAAAGVNFNQVSIAHYTAAGIDKKGAIQNISAQTSPYTVSGSGFDVFSPYGISSNQVLLPVKLVYFSGHITNDKKAALQWKVEAQSGIREYVIERSPDGTRFIESGRVTATNFDSYTYNFIDPQLMTGNHYYRLKIIEQAKTSYSTILRMSLKNADDVLIYPSPAKSTIVLQAAELSLLNSTVKIIDIHGKLIKETKISSLPQTIDIQTLPAGLYFVRLVDGKTYKVIKE